MTSLEWMVGRAFIRLYLQRAFAEGCEVQGEADGEVLFPWTGDLATALAGITSVDECRVEVRFKGRERAGFLKFVLGNDGPDVLSDYSIQIGWLVSPIERLVDRFGCGYDDELVLAIVELDGTLVDGKLVDGGAE